MEMTDYVKEFRTLQKSGKIRVADFCRERMLDYYEMVEALKRISSYQSYQKNRWSLQTSRLRIYHVVILIPKQPHLFTRSPFRPPQI